MTWFAAHVVMYVAFKDGAQNNYPVWENVLLIEADTPDAAGDKAERYGRDAAGDCDGTFRWGQRPASWVFAGVRKVVTCDGEPEPPGDGTELTYSEMVLETLEDVRDLAAGRPVALEEYE